MKITIVAVGLRQPAWADTAVEDYLGRFPKDWNVTVKAVKPELRAGQSTANIMKIEAERIRAAVPGSSAQISGSYADETLVDDFAARHGSSDARRTNLPRIQSAHKPPLSSRMRFDK